MAHQMEIWKPITDYEDRYDISNHGRVRSRVSKNARIIMPVSNGIGYFQIKLWRNQKSKAVYVHRLVSIYFVDGYQEGFEVDHIDNDKSNNAADNLRWVSRQENMRKCHIDNPHIVLMLNNQG